MLSGESLIIEGSSVDGEASCAISMGNVSSLDDEPINDSMKFGIHVGQFDISNSIIFAGA